MSDGFDSCYDICTCVRSCQIPMEKKPAVSSLQEFCSKSGKSVPIYEFTVGIDGYTCTVTAADTKSCGNGRTKREAKQLAAENMWRKLNTEPGVSMEIQNMDRDMLKELRDYCRLNELPMPNIKAVQQSSSCSGALEFVVSCSVGSVVRYGKSDNKKYARQKAASEVLEVISDKQSDGDAETETFRDVEEERKTFNIYKKLTDAGNVDSNRMSISDRHNYFKRFCPALKEAAFEVIRSDKYVSTKDKALSLMSALKLTPSIGTVDSTSEEPLLKVDLNCEFDCLILGFESEIFGQIIQYFQEMLV